MGSVPAPRPPGCGRGQGHGTWPPPVPLPAPSSGVELQEAVATEEVGAGPCSGQAPHVRGAWLVSDGSLERSLCCSLDSTFRAARVNAGRGRAGDGSSRDRGRAIQEAEVVGLSPGDAELRRERPEPPGLGPERQVQGSVPT